MDTWLDKAYEQVDRLIKLDGYDHSRAICEVSENMELSENDEKKLFRMWLENNNGGIECNV